MNEIKVSVCSPIHNEKDNILPLVDRVHKTMANFGTNWEQILVDDGSNDGSNETIVKLQKKYPNLVLYSHKRNLGERAAWKTAFDKARGEVIVLLAGDLQSPPEEIPKLLNIVFKENFDVGTGLRKNRKDSLYYRCATRILNFFMCVVFNLKVKDVSSSFFAVKSHFIKDLKLIENDHRYILAIFKKRKATIKEISVNHQARIAGKSHYTPWKVFWAIPEVIRFTLRASKGFYNLEVFS